MIDTYPAGRALSRELKGGYTGPQRAQLGGVIRSVVLGAKMAETVGFEPTEGFNTLTVLAGPRTRPDYATSPGRTRIPDGCGAPKWRRVWDSNPRWW